MKATSIGVWIRAHISESMIYLVMGVLALYILFVMKIPFFQRIIVVAVLIFGTYELINRMHGKPSALEGLQKGIQEAQKGMQMEMPDISDQMPGEGFGPFKQRRRR